MWHNSFVLLLTIIQIRKFPIYYVHSNDENLWWFTLFIAFLLQHNNKLPANNYCSYSSIKDNVDLLRETSFIIGHHGFGKKTLSSLFSSSTWKGEPLMNSCSLTIVDCVGRVEKLLQLGEVITWSPSPCENSTQVHKGLAADANCVSPVHEIWICSHIVVMIEVGKE